MSDKRTVKIGFLRGTFKLIHSGHIKLIQQAKSVVDVLYVFIDSDELIKSQNRECFVSELDRKLVVEGIKGVERAIIFGSEEQFQLGIKEIMAPCGMDRYGINCDYFYMKGGDYSIDALKEKDFIRSLGIKILICDHYDGSTTEIVNAIKIAGLEQNRKLMETLGAEKPPERKMKVTLSDEYLKELENKADRAFYWALARQAWFCGQSGVPLTDKKMYEIIDAVKNMVLPSPFVLGVKNE